MYYFIYKNVRDGAWRCLLDNKIDRLPVDVLRIARACGIRVIKNSLVNELLPGEHGKTYYDGNVWIVIYNDSEPTVVSRFAVAHELGHIFLGHAITHAKYAGASEFKRKPRAEEQADQFALRLLCPACVLWGMDLRSAEEIAEYCRVDIEIGKLRAQRMKVLYERDRFLRDPLEKAVYDNFKFQRDSK